MPNFFLSQRSLDRLEGLHPDLVAVVKEAITITEVDFGVAEGMRTLQRQQKLFDSGASQTMNSRHLTGHAVDLVAYIGSEVRWDWPLYDKISDAMKNTAFDMGVGLSWGGHWASFKDGPHFELSWVCYPLAFSQITPSQPSVNPPLTAL